MTHEEIAKCERAMKAVYRARAERLETQFEATLNLAADLLRSINETESDGSGVHHLKELVEPKTNELRAIIERAF